jgi:hypothetical protein
MTNEKRFYNIVSRTLRCDGKFPIEWDYPPTNDGQGDPSVAARRYVVDEVIPGDNPRPHVSYLHIKNVSFLGPSL